MKKPNNNFRKRVLHAGSWTMIGYIISQSLRLGSNLILTRLLAPEMFGVMSMVNVILIGINLFTDVGLLANIVKSKRGDDEKFLNTAWVIQIFRGIFLSILVFLLSYVLSYAGNEGWFKEGSVFADPVLSDVIIAMSLLPFIGGFQSTKLYEANKNLQMFHITVMEIISAIAGIVVMIILSLLYKSIWALVCGTFVTSILKMFLSHIMIPGNMNKFYWEKDAFFEIFHFGKWILLTSMLSFFQNKGDKLLLGNIISSKEMGIYSIAYLLATSLTQAIVSISNKVLLPTFGEVARERPNDLSNTYYKIRLPVDSICFILFGFLFVTGESIINILYDNRYAEAGWMLQILSVSLISVGFLIADKCFVVLGHVKFRTFLVAIHVLSLFTFFTVLNKMYGLNGAVWGIALSWLPRVIISLWLMKEIKLLQIKKEFYLFPLIIVGIVFGKLFNSVVS